MNNNKNKVRFGIEQLHIAFFEDGDWALPVHIPGTVGLTTSPDGGESTFYADNIKYYVRQTNNGYTGDLEVALIPDDIAADMYGWFIDNNGALVEDSEGNPKPFALMGQIAGDVHNRRFVYYNVTANRPGDTRSTKTDTADPQTQTAPLIVMPHEIEVDGVTRKIVRSEIEPDETNQVIYDGFFDSVYLPNGDEGGGGVEG